MGEHIVFFDGDCPLCYAAVRKLMQADEDRRLLFAPLEGETAKEILAGPNAVYRKADSLVLVEQYRSDAREFWIRSQAVFRIHWLLGSRWIGWLYLLPDGMTGRMYRLIARHRHRIRFGWQRPEYSDSRFLP